MSERKASQPAVEGQKNKDETDLNTILNESQRADLTLLVANATESMRKLIIDNFDAMAGLDKKLLRAGMTEDEKLMAADPANADVGAYDRERKLKADMEKDLTTLKMKNLKKNSLKAFDDWREQVILRVGQVVNSERTAQEQMQKGARADKAKPQAPNTTGKVMEAGNRTINLKFKDLFPPTRTPLTKMAMSERTLILHSLLLLLLSLEHYNAYSRVLLLNLTSSLKLPLKTFEQDEYATAKGLLEAAKEMSADDEIKRKVKENEETRKRRVRYATVAGAAILGVTGGMAAPLVAAGVGSVMGGLGLGATSAAAYLGSVAGSSVLVGSLFGAYGGRMTGQMMDSYAREVEDFQFLPIHGSSGKKTSEDQDQGAQEASEHDHKLRVTIGISGWLTEKEEVVKPWRSLGTGAEIFALKYELEALLNLGNAMNGMVQSAAWSYAQKEIIAQTIFADLAAAMWPMALMKVARVVDNPFSVAKSRADKAGEVLADALINRAQGERPVTLIGYSLGARVIYTCLMSLAKRKEFGLVENAVLIGAPTPSDTSDWRVLRSAVAGRLVNVYSVNDYVLGFMYRTSAIQYGVAGLQKVEGLASVENFDVSEDVSSHQRYRYLIGAILKKIGFEDIDMAAIEREQEELAKMEEEEKKQSLAAQRKWLLRRESNGGKVDEAAEGEAEADELEKKIQEQTKKSLVTRAIEYFYMPSGPSGKDAQKVAGNLAKAARDPTEAGDVAGQTAKDVQTSTESYATYIYKHLPSMPYVNRTTATDPGQKSVPLESAKTTQAQQATEGETSQTQQATEGLTGQAQQATEGVTSQAQSYAQQASQYLPSLPSMPLLSSPGKGKKEAKSRPVESATKKPTESASKGADRATSAAKTTAGTVSDVVTPTVENTLNPTENPAVKSTKRTAKQAPIIHQAKDRTPAPVKEKTEEVSNATGTTVQNAAQTAQNATNTVTNNAGESGKVVTSGPQNAGQTVAEGAQTTAKTGQGYTSRAASYLPSMSSLGFGGGGGTKKPKPEPKPELKPGPPKLQKRPSEAKKDVPDDAAKSAPPKLEKKPSAKLDRRPSGIESPAPNLERVPSGLKSPPPKLDRLPSSGVKSPPPKLDRASSGSGAKSPPQKPGRAMSGSGVKSPPTSVPTPNLVERISSASESGIKSPPPPPPKLGPRRASSQQQAHTPQPPTPAAIGERLASIPSGSTGGGSAAKEAGNAGAAAAGTASQAVGAVSSAGKRAGNNITGSGSGSGPGKGTGTGTGKGTASDGASKQSGGPTSAQRQGESSAPSLPGAGVGVGVPKGVASSAANVAGRAGETGINAAKAGGGYLAGVGKSVGLGR
ncbi:hypothetical protein A1O7_01029 [Cladophialophora yegresii CBS 114405]|uniref:DUF726-domain-containing protein n=1 Tax=Cladophialophora yegresii CBS 114405 TaxID=1182544 RepID=W9WJ90_9EURO|nr:uncharacterized protein A1O7_01029 [Cladophialophora yegresii CBS 114405]EXJ64691.1 hypothetical protein A1O7_01029 [Cladophialophora yegresii CBS 114405]